MTAVIQGRLSDGRVVCHTGTTDAPFNDPLANLPSVKFASTFPYLGVSPSDILTGTINLGSLLSTGGNATLIAHGKSYKPILLGWVNLGGVNVPAAGSFIARIPSAGGRVAYVRYNFSTTMTHISATAQLISGTFVNPVNTVNVSYKFLVLNFGLDAANNAVFPPYLNGLNYENDRVQSGYFDTNYDYFAQDNAGEFAIYRGPSLNIEIGELPGASNCMVGVVQNFGAYSRTESRAEPSSAGLAPVLFPGNNAGFVPDFVRVKKL